MELVIIAGGKGTRLGLDDIPKPMVELNSKPLLEYQILLAKRYGIKNIYILSGHLSRVIVDYFGNGTKWKVNIVHIIEDKPLGTAGALKQLEGVLKDRFMVFYGDTIMDIDLTAFITFDAGPKNSIGSIMVHPNDHPYDSDLIEVDNTNRVIRFHPKPHDKNAYHANLVNAALYILSPNIFKYIQKDEKSDFGKDIFSHLIETESLYAYKTTEYIKDIGTPERLDKVKIDMLSGKVKKANKSFPQKAIFMDRDGVINKEVNNLQNISNFELIDRVSEAIKLINNSQYLAIVVTNQPIIAKGFISVNELEQIHKKMDSLLGEKKAYIDDLYYCPHHPQNGFKGEVIELKIDCDCRKPKSGMLLNAAKDHHIDLRNSWMIGDRYADIKAGNNVGCKTILVRTGHGGNDMEKFADIKANYTFPSLIEAVTFIFSREITHDNNQNTLSN